MREFIIASMIGYLLGNIQTSYLLGKYIKKIDIRTVGQGNAGASNAVESLGWKFGAVVAMVDILKGVAAVVLVRLLFQAGFDPEGAPLLYTAGYFAVLGHIYPFFMNFKGGKGTATMIGILLGMNPVYGVIGALLMIITTFMTEYIVVGALALVIYIPAMTFFRDLGMIPLVLSVLCGLLSIKLHVPNYRRIQEGKETKLSNVLKRMKQK